MSTHLRIIPHPETSMGTNISFHCMAMWQLFVQVLLLWLGAIGKPCSLLIDVSVQELSQPESGQIKYHSRKYQKHLCFSNKTPRNSESAVNAQTSLAKYSIPAGHTAEKHVPFLILRVFHLVARRAHHRQKLCLVDNLKDKNKHDRQCATVITTPEVKAMVATIGYGFLILFCFYSI